ncbi:MAG: GH3 auxin-responsive promoter family protein, partial [Hydrotalea flava]|nr:GH3 auxin-responsive promoter family protein [Hydrotalea flava]
MNLKSLLARPFAFHIHKTIRKSMLSAVADQEAIFKMLLKVGKNTKFGKDHQMQEINSYAEFAEKIPIRDYEQ